MTPEERAILAELLEDDSIADEIMAILTATDRPKKLENALVATQRLIGCEGIDEELREVMRAAVNELLDLYMEETKGEGS